MKLYAHTSEVSSEKELLKDHLQDVANLASSFASKFGAGDFGWLLGAYHDLGKSKPSFQSKLEGKNIKVQHSAEGARRIIEDYESFGHFLAPSIMGHHSGLPNGMRQSIGKPSTSFEDRRKEIENDPLVQQIIELGRAPEIPSNLNTLVGEPPHPFKIQFFMRMLFSCLVDADFIATENWHRKVAELGESERGWHGELKDLRSELMKHLQKFDPTASEIARIRNNVLQAAQDRANDDKGFFTMTVPTGGGKTLSSLSFAIDHAIKHNMDRVIYVVPYTSIIEQNAEVFREVFQNNPDAILEHHSTFDVDGKIEDKTEQNSHILATQNWDRPIIVTTAVQFFESQFANRTSKCRKLHNIVNSVIILDEAQTIPLKLMRPCLAALKTLVEGYGTTVVLCTATQPAVISNSSSSAQTELPEALPPTGTKTGTTREITPDPISLYESLKRVKIHPPEGKKDDQVLSSELLEHEQVLCIVNNRSHAKTLFDLISNDGNAFHLTTSMTAAHRRETLKKIRGCLNERQAVRVISTSLIEAGVDIDFPCVYRSLTGIDSIAQAAGRCNREGKMSGLGQVFVFDPEGVVLPPEIKENAQVSESVFNKYGGDILTIDAVHDYYDELIRRRGKEELDSKIIGERMDPTSIKGFMDTIEQTKGERYCSYAFADLSYYFRFIEDRSVPTIVSDHCSAYGISHKKIDDLSGKYPKIREFIKDAQNFLVQVPRYAFARMWETRKIYEVNAFNEKTKLSSVFYVLQDDDLYDEETGLDFHNVKDAGVDYLMI